MLVELKENTEVCRFREGDAFILKGKGMRIIIKTSNGYGSYSPAEDRIYYETSKTIGDLLDNYNQTIIERVIRREKLKIVEV